jgi:hypothetical protein
MKFSDKYSNIFCKFYVNNYDSILNNFDNYLTKYNASYKMFRNKLNLDINVNPAIPAMPPSTSRREILLIINSSKK